MVDLAVFDDGVPGDGHVIAVGVLLHVDDDGGEGIALVEGAGAEDGAVLLIGLAAVPGHGLVGGDGELDGLLGSGRRVVVAAGSGAVFLLHGNAVLIAQLVAIGHVFAAAQDDRAGRYGHKALRLLLHVQRDGIDDVAGVQLAGIGPAVGNHAVAVLHRGVGADGDDLGPLGFHPAVGVGLGALTRIKLQAAAVFVGQPPAGELVGLGVGRGDGRGVGAARGQRALRAGGVLVQSFRDGDVLLFIQRSQYDHQRVDRGIHGGGGGDIALVKLVLGPFHGAGLQGQQGALRVGGEGEGLAVLGLHRVAPDIGALDVVALGRRDEEVLLQQILQNGAAGAAAHRRVVRIGSSRVRLADGDGAGLASQLLSLFLGADGDSLARILGVGDAELVDQRFLAGQRNVHIVRQSQAAGKLEHEDQGQQQAQHHAHVLLHGNHLKMKRLSGWDYNRMGLGLTRGGIVKNS